MHEKIPLRKRERLTFNNPSWRSVAAIWRSYAIVRAIHMLSVARVEVITTR